MTSFSFANRRISASVGMRSPAKDFVEPDPNHAPAHFALALAKAWTEQGAAAVAAFQTGLAHEPDAGKRRGQTTLFLEAMASTGSDAKAMKKQADADYKAAKAKCKPMKGDEEKACKKDAKAAHEKAEADVKRAKADEKNAKKSTKSS